MELQRYLPEVGEIRKTFEKSVAEDIMKVAHFWQFESIFVCPTIGMCLSLAEQKQIIKKCGISIKNKGAFEIHELLVTCADGENRLSKRVDNQLRKKFNKSSNPLLTLGCDTFMEQWRSSFKRGSYVDVFWAAAARPSLPPEYKREIFGDVHMAMHWTGEQRSMYKQKMTGMQRKTENLINDAKEAVVARRKIKKDNKVLQGENKGLQDKVLFLEAQNHMLWEKAEKNTKRLDVDTINIVAIRLEKEKNDLVLTVKEKDTRLSFLEKKNKRLSAEIAEHRELAQRLKDETRLMINEFVSRNQCGESCPSFDLCQKRFLIVGGITRMESLYRELIESSGGRMEYHDGYMKTGTRKLENLLKRSDVVLCPVSCNSHAACSMVKNLAKKHRKPVHMLTNSSLSAVTRVMLDDKNKQAVIN